MPFRKLRRLLDYIENPILFSAKKNGVRVDFVSELVQLRDEFGIAPGTVIDVGANHGEFIKAAQFVFPKCTVAAFEPIPHLYEKLEELYSSSICEIYPYALDMERQSRDFFVTGADDLSSLLKPTALLRTRVHNDEQVAIEPVEVEVRRIDEILNLTNHTRPVFMKIDTQGSELGVLHGAEKLFAYIDCIKFEYDFDNLYEGQASLLEIFSIMGKNSFKRFLQIDTHYSEKRIRRCDFLFFRD